MEAAKRRPRCGNFESFFDFMRQLIQVAKKEMKVRIPRGAGLARFFLGPVGRWLVIGASVFFIVGLGVFIHYYSKYAQTSSGVGNLLRVQMIGPELGFNWSI